MKTINGKTVAAGFILIMIMTAGCGSTEREGKLFAEYVGDISAHTKGKITIKVSRAPFWKSIVMTFEDVDKSFVK
jgi:hypothetical protein